MDFKGLFQGITRNLSFLRDKYPKFVSDAMS